MGIYFPPTKNALQKTLDAQLDAGVTASATLSNTTGVQNKAGIMLIDRVDSSGALKPVANWEWISFTGTSGATVTTLTRGLGGSTDQVHAVGAIVEFVSDVVAMQSIIDAITGVSTDLVLNTPKLLTQVNDTNGNELIKVTATASAVNELTVANAAAGSGPTLSATGGDTDIDINITPKGTGRIKSATVAVPTISSTDTLTNKRITKRVVTTTDDASAVIDVDVTDDYQLSAVANATEFTLTGTPTDGQVLIVRYKDAGVSKALTWTGFTIIGTVLPTATTAGKWGYVGCKYNSAASQWHVLAVQTQA